ncbi:MAG: carbon-nitrogen hydrolase [Planctomycetota bacterium]
MADRRPLKLALLQHACGDDPAENFARVCDMCREAAGRGAELIVTQELFGSRYFCDREDPANFDLAEPIPGPTTRRLSGLAAELGVAINASLFERRAVGLYHNTSVLIGADGALRGRYRKMHVPDDPSYLEKFYFTPGDRGFGSLTLSDDKTSPRVGPLVCWDQWFPEAARLTAMAGAEVLLYPTAIGWHADDSPEDHKNQDDAWRTVMRGHAIANGVFVAAANRVGVEGVNTFWGGSFVADPMGVVIAEAGSDGPEVLIAELDLSAIERHRRTWSLFFRDRRPDAYGGLTRTWGDGFGDLAES